MGSQHIDAVVAGGGGFIGGHLVADLVRQGLTVRSVDIKPFEDWYQVSPDGDNRQLDLSEMASCQEAVSGARYVYNLAADMGGMGFIENNKALCMLTVLESTHMLLAAQKEDVERFFFSSSACVYAAGKQTDPSVTALKEDDAYPAMPEDGYGWEKLFTERMCRHFSEDFGLPTRVARYHNVYGPQGTYQGGREKAPAAICRKVALAPDGGEIEIWGDGKQTRSFLYIDECLEGTIRLMRSDFVGPVNIGSDEMVTVDKLVDLVASVAGKTIRKRHIDGPTGVRGRNSDNRLIGEKLSWSPSTVLIDGLRPTYAWICSQVRRNARSGSEALPVSAVAPKSKIIRAVQ